MKTDNRLHIAIGEQIRLARSDRGYSQQQLADLVGVSRSQLAQWESGIRTPKDVNLGRIAGALSLSLDELIHYSDANDSSPVNLAEVNHDPIQLKIEAINLLIHGLSDKGLNETLMFLTKLIHDGGDNLRPLQKEL